MDGIKTSPSWNNLAWARDACSRNGGASFSFADPDWQSDPSLTLEPEFSQLQGLSATNGRLRRAIVAKVSSDGQQLESLAITLEFQLTVTKSGIADAGTMNGLLNKTITDLPLEAATSLPVGWSGTLRPPGSKLGLYDADLLDGKRPAVLTPLDGTTPPTNLTALFEVATTVRLAAGSPDLRLVVLETAPSALTEANVRSAFLNAPSFPPVTDPSLAVSGLVWSSASQQAGGILLQTRSQCEGSSCSAMPFVSALRQIVLASSASADASASGKNLCAEPVILPSSLRGSLSVDIAVTGASDDLGLTSVLVRGMSARSEALFRCSGSGSYIGIALSVAAPLNDSVRGWSLHAISDQRTAVSLLRATPLITRGGMAGSVRTGADFYTVVPYDLFSSYGGGLLLPDQLISEATLLTNVTALFATLQNKLLTGVAPINSLVVDLFPIKETVVSALVSNYTAQTLRPTLLGFLHHHSSLWPQRYQMFFSNDGHLATLSVDLRLPPQTPLSATDNNKEIISASNATLLQLGNAVKSQYSDPTRDFKIPSMPPTLNANTPGSLAGFLACTFTIDCTTVLGPGVNKAESLSFIEPPRFYAVGSIRATFTDASDLFSSASITYDYGTTITTISATIAKPLQGQVGAMVGLTLDGQLATDGEWNDPSALQRSLESIAGSIADVQWARTIIRPFVDLDLGLMVAGVRLADMVWIVARATASMPAQTTRWALAQRIGQTIVGQAAGDASAAISVHVVPLQTSMDVTVVVHSLRRTHLSSSGTAWDSITSTMRLAMPVSLTTQLRFIVDRQVINSKLVEFSVRGGGRLEGWKIPFNYFMLSGVVTSGVATLTIDQPSTTAQLQLAMNVTSDRLRQPLRALIQGDNLVDPNLPATLRVTNADGTNPTLGTQTVSSSRVLSAISEAILPALPQTFTTSLNVAILPIKKPLGAVSQQFSDAIKNFKPWMTTYSADYSLPLLRSAPYCSGNNATALVLNFTINQALGPVTCKSDKPLAPATVSALSDEINALLAACKLNDYLSAGVLDSQTTNNQECGHVGIFAAVPGIVWNLVISTLSPPGNVSFGTTQWILSPKPVFTTWTDVSRLLSAILEPSPPTNNPPEWTTVDASLVVPPELKDYYPAQLSAVGVRLAMNQSSVDQPFELLMQISTADDVLSLQPRTDLGSGSVRSSLSAQLVAVFGGPTLSKLTLSTNYDGVNTTTTTTKVPSAPNNTFVLVLGVQALSPGATSPPATLDTRKTITLPPGKLLSRALIEDLPPQLDDTLRPMLVVNEVPSDPYINPVAQVELVLRRYQLPDGRWLMPTGFGFADVPERMLALKRATNVPSPSVLLAKDLTMSLAFDVQTVMTPQQRLKNRQRWGDDNEADGRIAILSFGVSKQAGRSQMKMTVRGRTPFLTLPSLYLSRDKFFDLFEAVLDLNNTAQATGLVMKDLDRVDVETPDVHFSQEGCHVVDSQNALNSVTKYVLTHWEALFKGTAGAVSTFVKLLQTNNSICEWVTLGNSVSKAVANMGIISNVLPFTHTSFGKFLSETLVTTMNTLQPVVCSTAHEPFSLSTYCTNILKDAFSGTTAFCKATLTLSGLIVDITVVPFNRSFSDHLRIDTGELFGDSSLPAGVSSSSDILLAAEFDFRMRFVASFDTTSGVTFLLDPQATAFTVRSFFDASGSLQAYFGPISIDLLTARAWMGSPATLTAHIFSPNSSKFEHHRHASSRHFQLALPPPAPLGDGGLRWQQKQELAVIDSMTTFVTDRGLSGRIMISGKAGFETTVSFSSTVQCKLNVDVPDLQALLTGIQKPVVKQTGCGKGFVEELRKSLADSSLLDYFLTRFIQQWESGFLQFLSRLFTSFKPVSLPLVDQLWAALITDTIDRLSGPNALNGLTGAIKDIAKALVRGGSFSGEIKQLEQLLLKLITEAICSELSPLLISCPPVPNVDDPEYLWPLHFGGKSVRPLDSIDFALGAHGFASLDIKCSAELAMEWSLPVVIGYNFTHGLVFRFEQAFAFEGDIDLTVSDGCKLSGSILWLGAELDILQPHIFAGKLTVDRHFEVNMVVSAQIYGRVELGIGGELAERLAGSPDALDALPHWQAILDIRWNWSRHNSSSSLVPSFTLSKIQFCIGRMLVKVIKSTVQETTDKFLKPLEPVLGRDGLLLKPIPGLSDIFGSNFNLVQLLDKACKLVSDCQSSGVIEALQIFLDVFNSLDDLNRLANKLSQDGCNVMQLVQDFSLDFSSTNLAPISQGSKPRDGLVFTGDADKDPQLKQDVNKFYRGVTTKGSFGVRLYVFENVAMDLVNVLLGKDFPLVGVTLPDVTFFVGVEWWIPVGVVPFIEIVVGVDARLTFSFGGVALMYSGIAEAIKTGSPGVIFGALALPTRNDDGSQRWPIQAAIGFRGGVGVDLFLIRGSVYVLVVLEGDIAFVEVDNDGWVTFNEIAYLIRLNGVEGALHIRITLSVGVGVKLEACINLIFFSKCFTLFNIEWKQSWPLYDNQKKSIASVADATGSQTSINLDMTKFNPNTAMLTELGCDPSYPMLGSSSPAFSSSSSWCNGTAASAMAPLLRAADGSDLTFSLFQTPTGLTVDYTPVGVDVASSKPHLSRSGLLTGQTITSHGDPGNTPFTWSVGFVGQPITFPPYTTASLRLLVSEYPGVSSVSVTPQSVTPNSASGVSLSTCAQVHLAKPTTGVSYSLWGVPCPTTLEATVSNNISIAGPIGPYNKRPVSLTGEAWGISSTIPATSYTISSTSLAAVEGSDTAQISLPPAYKALSVSGDLQRSSLYTLSTVMAGVSATITAGSGDDRFVIQSIQDLLGSTLLVGGAGVDAFELTIPVIPGVSMEALAAPNWLAVQNGQSNSRGIARRAEGSLRALRHVSVEQRTYIIKGAANTRANLTLLPTVRDDSVTIVSQGVPGSTIVQQITGCHGQSEVRYRIEDGGDHELHIGKGNLITDMKCTVWVDAVSNPTQTVSIFIEASAEARALQYDLQANSLLVYDVTGDGNFFHLMFDQVQRVRIQFGKGGSILRMAEGTAGTEFLFQFLDSTTTNIARVTATVSPVLFFGHVTRVDIGPEQDDSSGLFSVNPLLGLFAPVAITQKQGTKPALVQLKSGTGERAPPQYYHLDNACLALQDRSTSAKGDVPLLVQTKPSSWLCGLMGLFGLPLSACTKPCPVVYSGPIQINISTGWADDAFYGAGVGAASVAVSLGPGKDNITWASVPASAALGNVEALLDLGTGTDLLMLAAPVRNVTALLGNDNDVDQVDVFSGDLSPNVNGNKVAPIGPYEASLLLEQLRLHDLLNIYGGSPSPSAHTGLLASQTVVINASVPGQIITMDARSSTSYHIVGTASSATINLNGQGRSSPPFPVATNWEVIVDVLPTLGISVNMYALRGSNSTAVINVAPAGSSSSQSISMASLEPDGLCSTLAGMVLVRSSYVDHLKINSESAITAEIDGTAMADLVISTPNSAAAAPSQVTIKSVENTTLVLNATLILSTGALLAKHPIVVVGNRSAFSLDYNFPAGASFTDGCLRSNDSNVPTDVFSPWFVSEMQAAGVTNAAAQACSVYMQYLASVDLTTPSLRVRGLGPDGSTRQLNLNHVATTVFFEEQAAHVPWEHAEISYGTLTVKDRFQMAIQNCHSVLVASPVFGPANTSVLDVLSSIFVSPQCLWRFGEAYSNGNNSMTDPDSGATLLLDGLAHQVVVSGRQLAPRHMPLVRISNLHAVTVLLHNVTNATLRDVVLTNDSLSVTELKIPQPHFSNSTSPNITSTSSFTQASTWFTVPRATINDNHNESPLPLVALEWSSPTFPSQPKSRLSLELLDGINQVTFDISAQGWQAVDVLKEPTLAVHSSASVMLLPPYDAASDPSVSLLHTVNMKAQLDTQFLDAIPSGSPKDNYCLQPTRQCDTNSWLWLSVRDAPWMASNLPCRTDDEVDKCWNNVFILLDDVSNSHRLRTILDLTPMDIIVPANNTYPNNTQPNGTQPNATSSTGAADDLEAQPSPVSRAFALFIIPDNAVSTSELAEKAPTGQGFGLSVLILFGTIVFFGFVWWAITGSVIPSAWGPFIITAALEGLIDPGTTWDPRIVSVVEAAHWMMATFVSGCERLSIYHICIMAVFLLLGSLALGFLFLKPLWKYSTLLRRSAIALAVMAIPFVISQAPAKNLSNLWTVFTGFLCLCTLFVLISYVAHSFTALRTRRRRYFAVLPAFLATVMVVVGMSVLTRLGDSASHDIIFACAVVAVAIDGMASLISMLVLTSLVKGWLWRLGPAIISALTVATSVACGLTFLFTIDYHAGELPLTMWYVWAFLPTISALVVLALPCPVDRTERLHSTFFGDGESLLGGHDDDYEEEDEDGRDLSTNFGSINPS